MNDDLPIALAQRRQRQAAAPTLNVFVSANAGSGKTRVLVDRVVRLLLAGAPPERVLCLTYTKAAANEMQSRLFDLLGKWSVMADEKLVSALTALAPDAPPASAEQLRRARALFARALETPGGLRVQTIHAFCERLLRRFPLEAGVEPGFEILDEAQAQAAADRARRRIAAHAVAAGAAEADALRAAFGVLAAAIDDRAAEGFLAWASAHRAALREVLARGGVDGACAALASRLGVEPTLTPETARARAWAEAPHDDLRAAAAALAGSDKSTDLELGAGLAHALDAADPGAAYEAYADTLFTKSGDRPLRSSLGTKGLVADAPLVGRLFGGSKEGYGAEALRMQAARDAVRAAETVAFTRAGLRVAEAYLEAYADEKRRLHALDFADLIDAARQLLIKSESSAWVRYKLDGGVDHVLVDEAQDTAPEQWDLIEALTEEFYVGAGARDGLVRTTFVVGDEKQSIYSFQGADPARFLEVSRELGARAYAGGGDFESISFDTSFRCAPEVLKVVDATFGLPEVVSTLLGAGGVPGGDVPRHSAARAEAPGVVEWWPLEPRVESEAPEDVWAPLDAEARGDPQAALADRVARTVRDWIAGGEAVADRDAERDGAPRARSMRPGDVMILLRKRSTVFETVIRRLKFHGVPVAGADRMTLKAQLAVEDLLGAARVALLPEDDLALAELLKSPLVHPVNAKTPPIDEDALFDLAYGRTGRLWHALRDTKDKRFAEAAALVKDLVVRAEEERPFRFLAGLVDRASPTGESYAHRLYKRLGPEAEDPIEELLARALAHERRGAPSLERFVHETLAERVEVKREGAEAADVVRVMTVHGAKGLEAPVVIVPDLGAPDAVARDAAPFLDAEAGVVWSPIKAEDAAAARALREARAAAADAERLRLLYVAMTRAEDRLVVCAPQSGPKCESPPASWHALVERGLHAAGATPFATETGEGLRLGTPRRVEAASAAAPAAREPIPAWARTPARAPRSRRRMVSPARGLSEDARPPPVLSPRATGGAARFRRGSLVHKLLEFLPELEPARRDAAARRFLDAQAGLEGDLDADAIAALLTETFAVLDDPAFAPLFAPGSRGEAPLAGRSPHLPPEVVVNGRVDRLAITDDEVLIVDYKTDRPPPASPEGVDSVYLEQMAAYRALLRALYPAKTVRAALLWTDGPRLMALPDGLLDAALTDA